MDSPQQESPRQDSPPQESQAKEMELTPELLEYAKAVALKLARKYCIPRIRYDDVVQHAMLHLLHRPPKYDPSRGAKPKTLINIVVQRAVMKFTQREKKHDRRYTQSPEFFDVPAGQDGDTGERTRKIDMIADRRPGMFPGDRWTLDDILLYIDSEESRAMCRVVVECDGNMSKAARRLKLSEGTVRYRLKLLGPKMRAAGFEPFG